MAKKTDIRLRRSNVANAIPGAANLSDGELAINTMDGALYFKKSDSTVITAHDDTILHIDSSNSRVGIGTTSPDYPLEIKTENSILFKLTSTASDKNARMLFAPNDDEKWNIGANVSNQDFTFFDVDTSSTPFKIQQGAATNTLVVDNDSRVGIGTANAGVVLHINHTNPNVRLQESDVTNGIGDILYNSGRLRIRSRADTSRGGIAFEGYDGTAVTEYARFNNAGNLGIGTNNPGEPLHIKHSDPKIKLEDSDGTNQVGTIFQAGELLTLQSRNNTSHGIIKFTGYNGTSAFEYARFNSSGYLGIGYTSPQHLLHLGINNTSLGAITTNKQIILNMDGGFSTTNSLQYKVAGFVGTTSGGTNDIFGSTYTSGEQLKNFYIGLVSNFGYFNSNRFAIIQGGSERISIPQGGNVGINTSSPARRLEVNHHGATIGLRLTRGDNAGNSLMEFANTAGVKNIIGHDAGRAGFVIGPSTTPSVTIKNSTGNVGIGTDSPGSILHISDASAPEIRLEDSDATSTFNITTFQNASGSLNFNTREDDGTFVSTDYQIFKNAAGANIHKWFIGNSEKLRLDASGNLLVGTTSAANSTAGFRAYSGGNGAFTIAGTTLDLNRLSSDGVILNFQKDTASVGGIGTVDGDLNIFPAAGGHKGLRFGNGYIAPTSNGTTVEDATTDLGLSTHRFKDLRLSGTAYTGALDVSGDIAVSGDITITDTSTDPFLKLATSERNYVIRVDNSDADKFQIRDVTASATRLSISAGGKVGIGTVSPNQPLEVAGRIRSTTDPTFEAFESSSKRGGVQWNTTSDYLNVFAVGGNIILDSNGNHVGVGPGGMIPNQWASYTDSAATVFQVKDTSDRARIVINGGNGAHLDLVDYAGSANDKHMNIAVDAGILKFGSLNDAGNAFVQNNIMVMDLGTGNVGIGNANPGVPLDVSSNSSAQGIRVRGRSSDDIGQIDLANNSGTARSQLQWNNSFFNIKALAAIPMIFYTNSAERMRIQSSGKVGIGTTSPDSLLSVTSTTINSEDVVYLKSGADNVNDYLGIAWELGVGGNGPHAAIRSFAGPSGSDARLGFLTTSDGGTTLTEALSIAHNSYVGIGTTSPAGILHVDGHTSSVATILEGNGNGDTVPLHFRVKANNNNVTNHGIFGNAGSTGAGNFIQIGASNTSGISVMSTGNVGIGITSPTELLHVKGTNGAIAIDGNGSSNTASIKFINDNERSRITSAYDSGGGGRLTFHTDSTGGSLLERLRISNTGAITFNSAYTFPTADGTAGQVLKTDGSGNLTFQNDSGGGSAGSSITDTDNDTKIQVEENADEDIIRFDIAGTQKMLLNSTELNLTGDLIVSGNFNIAGDINSTSVTNLDVTDKTITMANNSGSSTAADGAGIIIEGPTNNAQMLWDHGNQYLELNKDLFTPGSFIIGTTGTKVGRMYNSSGVMALEAYTTRQISFGNATNGEHVRIDADGKVGIGTTAPAHLLHIKKPSSGDAALMLETVTGGDPTIIFNSAAVNRNGLLKFQDNGTNVGRIQYVHNGDRIDFQAGSATGATMSVANGKVGIGTTNPSTPLDVAGIVRISESSNTAFYGGDYVRMFGNQYYNFRNSGGSNIARISMSGSSFFNGGNVGIGTTSPQTELEISAAQSPFLRLTSEKDGSHDAGDIYGELQFFTQETYGNAPVVSAKIQSLHTRAGSGHSNGDAGLAFFTSLATNDATATERMRIESATGNVGIGEASPGQKLQVNGNIRADGSFNIGGTIVLTSTRGINAADGTAAAPTHTFHSDQDTGMYRIGANHLGFSTGGSSRWSIDSSGGITQNGGSNYDYSGGGNFSIRHLTASQNITFATKNSSNTLAEKMRIRGDGNVGIGTSTPAQKLTVNGAVFITDDLVSPGSAGTYQYNGTAVDYNNNGTRYWSWGSGTARGTFNFIQLENDGTNQQTAMSIDASGNVGIGTGSPSRRFEIHENTTNLTIGEKTGYTPSTYGPVLETNANAITLPRDLYLAGSQASLRNVSNVLTLNGDNGTVFRYYDGSAGQEGMRLTNAGKVGIGTNAPAKTVEISYNDNTTNIGGNLSGGPAGPGLLIKNTNTTANIYANLDFRANNADGRIAYKYNSTNDGDFHFITDNNDSIETKLIIKNTGNVGIGTTAPGKELDVIGTVRAYDGSNDQHQLRPTQLISYATDAVLNAQSAGDDVRLNTQNSTVLIATAEGTVGIGTTSPDAMLRIDQDASAVGLKVTGGAVGTDIAQFKRDVGATTEVNISGESGRPQIRFIQSGGNTFAMGSRSNSFEIADNSHLGSNTRLTIDNTGRIGIGVDTGTQLAKLQVEVYGIDTTTNSTSATTQVAIHTFPIANFRTARFTIQITNTTDSTYHSTEIIAVHDGTTANITEFGEVHTGSSVEATFDADVSSGNFRLLATPTSTNSMSFKVVCHSITV